MVDPILYSFRRCPYAMRARLALAASGVRYQLREVRLADKPAALVAASPKATVPVLLTSGGVVIDESLAIMRWALALADPEDWLARDDPGLVATNDGLFKHHLDRYKYGDRHQSDRDAHREGGLGVLRALDARLAIGGQLCGRRPGLADAAIMPFVRQFAGVEPAWFDAQPLPSLKVWLAGHLASHRFGTVMIRTAPWIPGSPPIMMPGADGADARYR